MIFGHDLPFWISALLAALFKVWAKEVASPLRGAVIVAAALFAAWIGTGPLLQVLKLNPAEYQILAAALVALTGEGIMRWLIGIGDDPKKLLEWIKVWRGGA